MKAHTHTKAQTMDLWKRIGWLLAAITIAGVALRPLPIQAQDDEEEEDAVPITVTEVLNEDLAPGIPAAGTVYSRNAAQITAGLAARLKWVAEPGDYIRQGDPVALFDCEMIQLQREEQRAQHDRERARYESLAREIERMEAAKLATSELQIERVKANRDVAFGEMKVIQVRVRQFENTLNRCTERAPFAGVVTQQLRRGGEDVPLGEALAAMTDISHLEVRASVPIRHLPRMRTGVIARVRMNELEFQGLLRTVVPAADATSQTFEVRIDLPEDAPAHVAAGQLVSVTLPLSAQAALTVPRDSIVLRAEGAFVMRIDTQNKAESVLVEVADSAGEKVSVVGDLKAGDRIAVRGAEALDDGELVAILSGP